MDGKRILFISGSIGLGHVIRDLAIAAQLRRQDPGTEIAWLAAQPAAQVLRQAAQRVLAEAALLGEETGLAEDAARGGRLNLLRYLMKVRKAWARNVEAYRRALAGGSFDLVIADEAYELAAARGRIPELARLPLVMIYDFVGLEAMTGNPLERLGIYLFNRAWARGQRAAGGTGFLGLFAGELEDVPDRRFGPFLPNRRRFAGEQYRPVGYVLGFDAEEYRDRAGIRARLGYGGEPLVICAAGGTSIGRELLELCGRAWPPARERIPGLRMVLVCGPRIPPGSLRVPRGVEVRGYVPALFEHFAAGDLAVVQGGGGSTLELAALRRPFIYFPLEEHCEQRIHVAVRLRRHAAGVEMLLSRTTPSSLAEAIAAHLGEQARGGPIPADGARQAARLIRRFLYAGADRQVVA